MAAMALEQQRVGGYSIESVKEQSNQRETLALLATGAGGWGRWSGLGSVHSAPLDLSNGIWAVARPGRSQLARAAGW